MALRLVLHLTTLSIPRASVQSTRELIDNPSCDCEDDYPYPVEPYDYYDGGPHDLCPVGVVYEGIDPPVFGPETAAGLRVRVKSKLVGFPEGTEVVSERCVYLALGDYCTEESS